MLPVYPERWAFEPGAIIAACNQLGGLISGENHMVLVNRKGAFERAIKAQVDGFLEDHTNGLERGKTTIACLQPGSKQACLHTDTGGAIYDDGACELRYHLPLQTSDQALFQIEDVYYRMPLGGIYLINPSVPHRVLNGGDHPRVHLFFNALEKANGS